MFKLFIQCSLRHQNKQAYKIDTKFFNFLLSCHASVIFQNKRRLKTRYFRCIYVQANMEISLSLLNNKKTKRKRLSIDIMLVMQHFGQFVYLHFNITIYFNTFCLLLILNHYCFHCNNIEYKSWRIFHFNNIVHSIILTYYLTCEHYS